MTLRNMTTNSEPPYLSIGMAVSAKYRGAFCEATVKKIVKSVKCRVFLKESQSNLLITDEYINGPLEIGATVEVKHPDTGQMMEASVKQMNDYSMYTVVFNDNDERTLRRSQLCLKGDKHFVESETLDNLPLSNPEHFGSPVIAQGKHNRSSVGACSNQGDSESFSEEDEVEDKVSPRKTYQGKAQKLVGRLMLYKSDDRRKSHLLPVLVVLPDASSTELKTKDQMLVRSFKDNKFLSVAEKDLVPFSREAALKNEEKALKPAMEKALLFVDNQELPQSWNREELLGVDEGHQEVEVESDDDEEQTEEKDRFVAQLYKFNDDRGTPINKGPSIGSKDLNLYRLFKIVKKLGGYNRVTNQMRWRLVYSKMLLPPCNTASTQIKNAYKKYLHAFEDFNKKLGSIMGTVSRPSQNHNDSGRGLVAFVARDLAKNLDKDDSEKEKLSEVIQSEVGSAVGSAAESMLPEQGTLKRKKSARIKAVVIKELTEEKPKDKSAATDVKKGVLKKDIKAVDERKEIKKVEQFPKKSLVRKVLDDKKEVKLAEEMKQVTHDGDKIEKRILKKKDNGNIKKKNEIQEELKVSQKRQRRSANKLEVYVDSKKQKMEDIKDKKEEFKQRKEEIIIDMEERNKDEVKIEEVFIKEEIADAKEEVIVKVEEHGHNKDNIKHTPDDKSEKRRTKKTKFDEIGAANVQNTENLPVGARLRVRYGKGKNAIHYEAKILEIGVDPGPRQYLVHYQGWNNRHDEWIKMDRIVKVLVQPSPSGGKKKLGCKQLPTPGRKVFKKKASFDKPPMSPSSVKSESSTSQGQGQQRDNSNKSSPAASASKLRSTRSNNVDLIVNALPGSENEASDASDNDSEPGKKVDKPDEMESAKTCNMLPDSESEKQELEAHDVGSSIGLVVPILIKVDNTEKDNICSKGMIANKDDNDAKMEFMLESSDNVLMKEYKDRYCEPILQKIETNFNSNLVKLESSCGIEVEEVIESGKNENVKKEICTHRRKPFINVDKLELNTECVKKVEKIKTDKKTVSEDDEKLEESQYSFKNEPEVETGIKIQEKKKTAVAENKDNVEKEAKPEPVMNVPAVVWDSKDDIGEDLLAKPSLNDSEMTKCDSEGEKRGKDKRMSSTEIDIESKKARVDTVEKIVCHVGNTLSVSPERKLFVTLAEKKQGFSPIVRKLIPSPEKCFENQHGKFESVPEECEKKRNETIEVKKVVEMVVVHKVSPVKNNIVIEKGVEVYNVDNESIVKNNIDNENKGSVVTNDNVVASEHNEVTSVASVRRKIRKKTKKKLEMEEIEAVTVLRKTVKRRLEARKTKDINNKKNESAIKVDAVEIDLHCDEQFRSCSPSPDRLSSSQSYIQESQGFVPHIKNVVCHINDSQGSVSYISKRNSASNSKSPVNKSNVFENTPPSSPEHDSDDVSPPNSQHNSIEISLQTFDGGSSKTDTSQPAGSESPDGNASPSNHSTSSSSSGVVAGSEGSDHVPMFPGKRQQDADDPAPTKCRKRSSRGKSSSNRIQQFGESDSEDTNMLLKGRSPHYCSNSYPRSITTCRSPRPPKYNFNLEDGQCLKGTARISFLVQKIREIHKLYMNKKSEVACIDRRRKKLKRKEKNREPQNSDCASSGMLVTCMLP